VYMSECVRVYVCTSVDEVCVCVCVVGLHVSGMSTHLPPLDHAGIHRTTVL